MGSRIKEESDGLDIRVGRTLPGSHGAEISQGAFVDEPYLGLRSADRVRAVRLIFEAGSRLERFVYGLGALMRGQQVRGFITQLEKRNRITQVF